MVFFLCSSVLAQEVGTTRIDDNAVIGEVDSTSINKNTTAEKVDTTDSDKNAIYEMITDFINKLVSKNFEGMFGYVSLNYGAESNSSYNMFKEDMESSLFKALRDSSVIISKCSIIDINKFSINNDVADFYLNFSCEGLDLNNINDTGRSFKKIVRVTKENGTWKISEWQSDVESYLPEIKETINKFINNIYSNNIDEAITYVSSRYTDKVGDYNKFKEEIRNRFSSQLLLMSCSNFIIKKYNSFFEDEVRLSISFECKEIKEGESASEVANKEMFFCLKKEGNVWKISNSSLLSS